MTDKDKAIRLFKATAPVFGLSYFELVEKSRAVPRPSARFAVFNFMAFELDWGCTRIQRALPFRLDHSSVVNGINRSQKLYDTDWEYSERCQEAWRDMRTVISTRESTPELNQIELEVNE